ncbi:ribonuclease T2 [Xylariomycetidae sp. FL0641]|nr:ribonuclease T2 [Xylariomycetidae sp. FL0641]
MAPSVRAALAWANSFVAQLPMSPPSSTSPSQAVLGGGDAVFRPPPYERLDDDAPPSCPIDGPVSCHNQTAADSCCFVYPGGRLLLTQFWDEVVHVDGGEQDWTVHGLWPDLCDGSYDQYCGMAPHFSNITAVLEEFEEDELVANMHRYWVAKYGTNDHLWAHEYNKHGTCINTLAPKCYGSAYASGREVVDYFSAAFRLFASLDTYRALYRAGIEPSYRTTYARADVEKALADFSGGKVVLQCGGRHHNVLHEAWYVYFVQGSLQDGTFVPAQDSFRGDSGSCAERIRYLPKRRR